MAARRNQTFDVFVGNLPTESNERNVGKLFTPFGEIGGIIVKESAKVKGPNNKFAFVKFLCEPDADRAVKEMNNQKLADSNVLIVVKRTDEESRKQYNKKKFGDNQGKKGTWASDTDSNDGNPTGGGGFQGGGGDIDREGETAMVTHIENPITLWVQIVNEENTKKIFNITEQLASLCPAAKHVTGAPESGKVYASLFAEDSMWYRCSIKQPLGTDRFKIQYIDYGNTEEVGVDGLVEIPPALAGLKPLAMKIGLHNCRAKDFQDKQAVQFLKSLTDNQMTQLNRTRSMADGIGFYANLSVNGQSVADAMIQAGHCQTRPGFGKTGQMGRPGQSPGPNELGDAPGPQMMTSMFTNKDGMPMQMPILSQPPPPLGAPMPMGFHMPHGGPSDKEMQQIQQELNKKRRELEKIRNERDAANMQIEYMRTKVKTLQDEFSASAAKLQEDTLSNRIQTLTNLAAMVRRLRDQFPTNSDKVCLLEEAIDMVSSPDRVDNSRCTTLSEVGSALARYKAAQDEISKCREQGEIAELVDTRDGARKELYTKLSVCLEELEKLPLDSRNNQVQDFQTRLATLYNDYMNFQIPDCPSLENLLPGFKSWKTKKDTEFTDVRTATDFCEGALQTALEQVKQRVSVETTDASDKVEVDLDELMKTYAHALQREISVTDQFHSKDANLVATVVLSVMRELQQEAGSLENFRVLSREFDSRRQVIEPWLDKKPEFADVQENRKALRSVKSKLRHTLADKIDLEESGSKEELADIEQEVEKLQLELQGTLTISDSLMSEIASLADTNFPELIVQYPDLGIDNYLLYKGLVKSNRELDHYCLTDSIRPGLHISTFNGETVLLQEFHIGDSEHCTKEVFLRQIVQYNGDARHIQAVFFSKNERQAFIQVGWLGGEPVEKVISSERLSPRELQSVSRQLVEAAVSLHTRGCVHGEITPPSVFCREDNTVLLMCPDFSKPVKERLMKRYVTTKGLVFQTPDLQFTAPEAIGHAADVYNVVLLLFMMHCPDGNLPTPMDKGKRLEPSLQRLFEGFMEGKNLSRVTAENVLQLDYFQREISDTPPSPSPSPSPAPLSPAPAPSPPVQQPVVVASPPPAQEPPSQAAMPPVVRNPNEPMEIGVFRAEDYMVDPSLDTATAVTNFDTDDSWTTKSSSSGSRVESPTEAALDARGADTSVNDSLQTVIEADCNSGDTAVVSGSGYSSDGVVDVGIGGEVGDSASIAGQVCSGVSGQVPAAVSGQVSDGGSCGGVDTGLDSGVTQTVSEDGAISVDSVGTTSQGPTTNGVSEDSAVNGGAAETETDAVESTDGSVTGTKAASDNTDTVAPAEDKTLWALLNKSDSFLIGRLSPGPGEPTAAKPVAEQE